MTTSKVIPVFSLTLNCLSSSSKAFTVYTEVGSKYNYCRLPLSKLVRFSEVIYGRIDGTIE